MAWTTPTVAQFRSRWAPRFDAVTDPQIQYALDRAVILVDETWIETDRTEGVLLYAAHMLTLDGLGTGAEAEAAAGGLSTFQRVNSGTFEFDRGSGAGAAAGNGSLLASTSFGRRLLELMKLNFPAVAIV